MSGRPTKYKEEYCEQVIEFMSKGYSFEAFAGHIRVAKDTLYQWAERHPEFSDAKKEAFDQSRLFWERAALENLITDKGVNFNSTIWIFNMKNRFNWRDKQEISGDDEKPLTLNYKLD